MTFVGREPERAALESLYDDVARGAGPRAGLVRGEPGVGKTALVTEVASWAAGRGASVVLGAATEVPLAAYQPFVQALGAAVMRPARSGVDGASDRFLLYGAVVSQLAHRTQEQPVVLVLDDLHWADIHTLELLHHVLRGDVGRLLVLVTYRDTDITSTGRIGETLRSIEEEPFSVAVALKGWDVADVDRYMREVAPGSLEAGPDLAHTIATESAGNPFFVSELVRHLLEREEDHGLPDSVREVVVARVARAGDDTLRLLSTAALIGPEFAPGLLATVSEQSVEEVRTMLDDAAGAFLVEPGEHADSFRFAHALVQHTLYDELSAVRRSRLHQRVAEVLEGQGDVDDAHAGELAHHFAGGFNVDATEKAAMYACQAGDGDLRSLAPGAAASWYEFALASLDRIGAAPSDPRRLRALVGLGDAERQAGRAGSRETLLQAGRSARDAGDDTALIAAALANNRGYSSRTGQTDPERVEVLEAALAVSGPESAERARLSSLLAMELAWSPASARRTALADDGVRIARALGDERVLAEVLHLRIMAIWSPATLAERVETVAELETLAGAIGDPVAEFWACFYGGTIAFESLNMAEVDRRYGRATELAGYIGQPLLLWTMAVVHSWRSLVAGDLDTAEVLADNVLQVGQALGQADALPIYGVLLFGVRWAQGRLAELTGLLASGVRNTPGLTTYQASYAMTCVEAGQLSEAAELLDGAARAGFTAPDLVWSVTMVVWAEVAARVGDVTAAARLYELLTPWAGQIVFNGAGIHGAIDHYLGVLAVAVGRTDDAASHFAAADTINTEMAMPFFRQRTIDAWAAIK